MTTLALFVSCLFAGQIPEESSPHNKKKTVLAQQVCQLFVSRCLSCHNAEKKKGGLDLSRRGTALQGGDSGVALLPGKPEESLLWEKIAQGLMPPQQKLTEAEKASIRAWITAGAPYEGEPLRPERPASPSPPWSFQPLQRHSVPTSRFDAWAVNPVDRFIFAKLQEKGLSPSPRTDKRTLLRRVTFDLTGLPPTPEELDAFHKDTTPNAYEKVVDRLLASPAYGERWARHWLDVVRFGESDGYEPNYLRPHAWPYRDYVIRAFNNDTPYPQFIAEQLAGDQLAPDDPHANAATGFLVAGVHDVVVNQTKEGTLVQRSADLDDMAGTTGAAFLGLTVACARCHDHKFDPIPQEDYYRLVAVFAGVRHGERPLQARKLTVAQRVAAEEAGQRAQHLTGLVRDLDQEARYRVLRQETAVVPRPAVDSRRNVERFPPVTARFVRFTVLRTNDGAEPCLDELEVYGPESAANLGLAIYGTKAAASSAYPGAAIHRIVHLNDGRHGNDRSWISQERGGGWAQLELLRPQLLDRVVWSRDATDPPRFRDRLATEYRLEVSLDGRHWQTVATQAGRAAAPEAIPTEKLMAVLSAEEKQQRKQWLKARDRLRQEAELLKPVQAYLGQFTPPETIHLLKRGDVLHPGVVIAPGALTGIPGYAGSLEIPRPEQEGHRRLALARWIGSERNPLTARVLVNRLWQQHFGQGIVATPSDLGTAGAKPSHPELLDWLAADFMKHGWRMKRLHKLLVMSYTYCQTHNVSPEGLAKDAGNELLGRMKLRRLEAEMVRDAILAVSGKLDRRMHGPGFALFLYRTMNVAIYEPIEEQGPATWRRSIYQTLPRAYRDDLLAKFDCPENSQRTPRRDLTTTPLQALTLLHSSFVLQQADFFAERLRQISPEPAQQLHDAFRLALGRAPTPAEQEAGVKLIQHHSLSALCRALFNANEFLHY
jgi:cytochrome c553